MKALVLKAYKQFGYEDVPNPEPGPDEVLVAVKACGICGSDVHGMDGSTGRRRPPIIMGHEAAGVISRTGSRVTGWTLGDRVTFDSTIYCGQCAFCRRGLINLCDRRRVLGVSCEDYRQHGAFAELVVVPQHILYRLPDGLAFEHAALVEPFSIALHAIRRAPPSLDDAVVVVGAGMIGLALMQALSQTGCGRLIVVDIAGDWHGPDFAEAGRYLAKYGIPQTIYTIVYDAEQGSSVATQHPDWLIYKGGLFAGQYALDQLKPGVTEWELKLLEDQVRKWGDYEWRKDDAPLHEVNGDATPLLAQDQNFRKLIKNFLDRNPGSAFHGCNGG
ncbi:MAG: alcohol dehydrogenase catalytic domain-containing protein, partial [Planctomycetota bacterium]